MPRREGLRPIGDSIKKIIEKVKEERRKRLKDKKSPRVQPKLPGLKKGGNVKSPKPGTYEYYLLNRPKHSPAPIKPQKMDKGGRVKKPIKVKKIAIGIGKAKDYPGIKKIIEMNKKGKKRFAEGGMIPKTPKQKKFAALAEPRNKITYADKIAGATGKSKKMKQGGMARGGGAAIRGNNFKGVY